MPLTKSGDDTRRFIGEGQRLWAERRKPLRDRRIRMPGRRHRPARLHRGDSPAPASATGWRRPRKRCGRWRALKTIEPGFWLRPWRCLVIRCSTEKLRAASAPPSGGASGATIGQRDHRRACPRPCDLHAVAAVRMARCARLRRPRANVRGVSAPGAGGSSLPA
ncbi:hypothetical protein ACPA9J_32265 [Pseudomonas aeruginosa]